MRAVIQRVTWAKVTVDQQVVGEITEPGLCVLVGVTPNDTERDVQWLVRKIADLRILREEQSAGDLGAPILVVSQFTLYADITKGRRPSWNAAAKGDIAEPMVELVIAGLRERGLSVATGVFGADMAVELCNDGPITIWLDSHQD